jgi:deoxyadenosine/deoxycytidine kinase
MTTIISIEGNIGAGKSTIVNELKKFYNNDCLLHEPLNGDSRLKKIIFLQEPVDEWKTIKDEDGNDILTRFYANSKDFSFAFQMMAYISRLALLRKTIKENPNSIIITERCLYTDRHVFAQMLFNSKQMSLIEYSIYLKWWDEFNIPIHGIVYLKTTPDISHQRVVSRNREGENIPINYLIDCHIHHDEYISLMKNPILEIDVNNNISNINEWLYRIDDFIKKNIV